MFDVPLEGCGKFNVVAEKASRFVTSGNLLASSVGCETTKLLRSMKHHGHADEWRKFKPDLVRLRPDESP